MGHGKSTVMDMMGCKTGYLADSAVGNRFTHTRADEKEKNISLRTTGVTMVVPGEGLAVENAKENYLLNFIDTPGHIEFSPEVASGMRMADSALVVVDVVEGVGVRTENLIGEALMERLKPALFVNKLDRLIIDLQREPEEIYQDCAKAIESANVAITTCVGEKPFMKDLALSPDKGNVIFGSALNGWGFQLSKFTKTYATKFGVDEGKTMKRLWGDIFFNPAKKSFLNSDVDADGKPLTRAFCQFICTPITQLMKSAMAGDAKWEKMATALGVSVKAEDKKLEGKALMKRIMQLWLNGGDAISSMCAAILPNPIDAQKVRCAADSGMYTGDPEHPCAKAMAACDPKGPLMVHISKMVPTGAAGRFYCVGRVFSGTLSTDKVRCQLPGFDPEDPETKAFCQESKVQSVCTFMGKDFPPVNEVPAGQVCAVTGIDLVIPKNATVTTAADAKNIKGMKFCVSAVVRLSVRPKDNKNLPKLVEGLKRLSKSDMLVTTISEESGDHVIAGCGDEHLKICIKDLKEMAGVEFTEGTPTVSYKETCIDKTAAFGKAENPALSKSPNKHNRLYVIAEPMEDELATAIEEYKITPQQDLQTRSKILTTDHGWDKADTLKIWGFGPADIGVGGANLIVDQTKGVQYLNEIKESVNSGLLWASKEGPLCEENMRGVRFNLMDVKLHTDSIHRGMGQIQPTARRVFYAASLTAMPRFLEPIFKVTIQTPETEIAGVRQAIAGKRGELAQELSNGGKVTVEAFVPVAETIGQDTFAKALQTKTSGKAFASYEFDHWKLLNADPLQGPVIKSGKQVADGSDTYKMMLKIRERKGLKVEPPDLADYLDKL